MNDGYNAVMRAYSEKDYEKIKTLYQTALDESSDPTLRGEILFCAAVALDALGRHTEALSVLKDALDINPESARVWNNIGIVCMKLERPDEAKEAFMTACSFPNPTAAPYISLGSLALKQSDPGNALAYLQTAATIEAGNPLVHANLALTLAVFGRLEEAEDALRLAVLYGFDRASAISERIEALKRIRDAMQRHETENDVPSELTDAGNSDNVFSGGDPETLARLEQEMHLMAERRFVKKDTHPSLAASMLSLRQVIRSLRRDLGLPEVLESDTCAGINYME